MTKTTERQIYKFLKKLDWTSINDEVNTIVTVFAAFGIIVCIFIFMLGFHNFDLGHNIDKLNMVWEKGFNETLVDYGVKGDGAVTVFQGSDAVQLGALQMVFGLFGSMWLSLLLGYQISQFRHTIFMLRRQLHCKRSKRNPKRKKQMP